MEFIKTYGSFQPINEGPGKGYYIKVAVRDAKKALAILDDMYRKNFDINGSDTYYFKDEDMAYDAMMDLGARDIGIIDTNIEESLDEKAGPCWDGYKIGSPKTKISSKSGKRVNNCVPIDEDVNEAEDYKYKKYVTKAFDKISDAMFEFRNAMGVKQLGQADPKLKKRLELMQAEIFALRRDMESDGLTEGTYNSKDHIGSTSDGQGSNAEIYKKGKGYYVIVSGEADYDFDAKNDKELLKKLKDNEFDSTDILEVNEATDLNDPVLMAFRATRRELPKFKPAKAKSRRLSFDKYMDLLDAQTDIEQDIKDYAEEMAQTFRDMEQEAEPEGGEMADKYGSIMMKQETEYSKLKAKKAKIDARIEKHRMA